MNKRNITYALVAAALAATSAQAVPILIDDFIGDDDTVYLKSTSPPQIATGSFAHAAAVGGYRDAAVSSVAKGDFSMGVSFDIGGYSSFKGKGTGILVWDGVAGISDANDNKTIDIAEIGLGLNLNLLSVGADPSIRLSALADRAGAKVDVLFLTSHSDYAVYSVNLTGTPGFFNDYQAAISSPTLQVGSFDPTNVRAVAMFVDASSLSDLDVQVKLLAISTPDQGQTVALLGLALLGVAGFRRVVAPA